MSNASNGRIQRVGKRLGMDRAIAFTMAGRLWASVASLISLLAVGSWMSQTEQGYYYTFSSVLGLQVLMELGLTYVIMQFASHERARLLITTSGTLDGDAESKARLASLLRLGLRWYLVVAILFVSLLLPAGYIVFSLKPEAQVSWQTPWCFAVLVMACTLFLSPVSAIIEGCGLVASAAKFRLMQSVVANTILWIALFCSAKLYAPFIFAAASLLCLMWWLFFTQRKLLVDLVSSAKASVPIKWREEIWPFQWRIALSWLSGYFIVQFFTPILFIYRGAVEAGQMGMSLTLMGVVSTISLSWINTKAPYFGMLAAQKKLAEMDILFFASFKRVLATAIFGSVSLISLIFVLYEYSFPLISRVLPPSPLILLVLSTFLAVIVSAEAIYLRAFKQEPFMVISVINGIVVTVISLLVVKNHGAIGMMMGYLATNLIVGAGFGTIIFRKERSRRIEESKCLA